MFTLAVEIFTVIKFGRVKRRLKAALIVAGANLASFLLPLLFFWSASLYYEGFSLKDAVLSAPFFIVGFGFLFLTLALELPIVYFALRRETAYSTRLLLSVIASNVMTTAAIAVTERLLCVDTYYA